MAFKTNNLTVDILLTMVTEKVCKCNHNHQDVPRAQRMMQSKA